MPRNCRRRTRALKPWPGLTRVSALALAVAATCGEAAPLEPASLGKPLGAGELFLSDVAAGIGGFVIDGQPGLDYVRQVIGLGDVNGDGLDDVIINATLDTRYGQGRAYVVFGKADNAKVDLSAVADGIGGFPITTRAAISPFVLSSTGDVNGDGLGDMAVCVISRGCHVIYGKRDTQSVVLEDAVDGHLGFAIEADGDGRMGLQSIAAAGDVNGDGLADLIIGRRNANEWTGCAYVVFGKADGATVQLAELSQGHGGGFTIDGPVAYSRAGEAVAGVGDVNGDGLSDLVVGAPGELPRSPSIGRAYIIFGKGDFTPVNLAVSWNGFTIKGARQYDRAGLNVAAAGDVNGDGLADVGVMASNPYTRGREQGQTYIVFGKTDAGDVELRDLDAGNGRGYVITHQSISQAYCDSLASTGDINGDGLADMIVGCFYDYDVDRNPTAYVVYGKADSAPVFRNLLTDGEKGIVIHGESTFSIGRGLRSAGDINGDGLPDLLVDQRQSGGRTFVVWGSTTGAFAPGTKVDQLGTPADERFEGSKRAQTLIGGAGHDVFVGHRGADVLSGGAGRDVFQLDEANLRALERPLPNGIKKSRLARVDGGTGRDTLQLLGTGLTLHLTRLARPGAGLPGSHSRVDSIERIDLGRQGGNAMQLRAADVQALTGMNLLNSRSAPKQGWRDGSYVFPEVVRRHQLVVTGTAGDTVHTKSGTWQFVGTVRHNGSAHEFAVYESIGGRAQVILDSRLQLSGFQ